MPQQTIRPLIEILQAATVPIWAVFADCANVFEKQSKAPAKQVPTLRRVIYTTATSMGGPDGMGVRILQNWVSANILKMPDELAQKRPIFITTGRGRLDVAENYANFVELVESYEITPALEAACEKKRAEVEEIIKAAYLSPILRPDKTLVGADGSPVQ